MSGISFFSDMVQSITDRGRRLLAAGARSEPVQAETNIETLCDMLLSSRGEASGMALAAEILQRWTQLDATGQQDFVRMLHEQFGPDTAKLDKAIERYRTDKSSDAVIALASSGRAAPPGTRAQTQPRAQRHGETGRDARAPAGRERCDGTVSRRRCRLRPPVRFLVQPRFPDPSPDRLVDAGRHPGEDHQIRGGARNRRLGRTAAEAGSRRPQVLCVLPPAARRRSADLRRGCADQGNPLRHR